MLTFGRSKRACRSLNLNWEHPDIKKAHYLLATRGHSVNWHFAKASLTKKAPETLKQTRDTTSYQVKHRITIE
jgi:hypothetical protein